MGRCTKIAAAAVPAVCGMLVVVASVVAAPGVANAEPAQLVQSIDRDAQHRSMLVHSSAMDRNIVLDVQLAADRSVPRPVLYLLNGIGGGEDGATWNAKTDVLPWLASKNINVVQPVGGSYSYYADWVQPDPKLGVNKWQTFLTQELPPLIDSALGTTGANAIAGISSSVTTVLNLAEAAPDLYRSVGAYSGCARLSDPMGQQFARLSISKGGGDPDNMYGPAGDPRWAQNDPYLNADRLRGKALYISNGSGLPGPHDAPGGPHTLPGAGGFANQVVIGGGIELATSICTHDLQARLGQLGIPATFNFEPVGTHSWGYWQDQFKRSWPVLSAPLGI